MPDLRRRSLLGGLAAAPLSRPARAPARRRPNVILMITDDQGYGDLSCHGNPVLRTPNLDRLHAQSVRLSDFHVDPLCAPTRSALMTGRHAFRNGVTSAAFGRSILTPSAVTMADIFRRNGYRTALYGKWHLGDNYPYRPSDRGFDDSVVCWSGGVAQAADYWGNDYFDDTYYHNNVPKPYKGYCTDVFYRLGMEYIEANRNAPFFLYLPSNAPHDPFLVDDRYSRPYRERGVPAQSAAFYGMIANLDENTGKLLARLRALNLENDTIVIWMTDNGTSAGFMPGADWTGFNAGMRGKKGMVYEGGHRVPCFVRWPGGGIQGGRDVRGLTAHIDLLPTLTGLCGLETSRDLNFDGVSLAPALSGNGQVPAERFHFVQQNHRRINGRWQVDTYEPWRMSAVLYRRWRLIEGRELYDLEADPAQTKNMAAVHPGTVSAMRAAYERWWEDVSPGFREYFHIVLGSPKENPCRLSCFDWHGEVVPANQEEIRKAPAGNGFWAVEIAEAGEYEFTLRQRPDEFPIQATTARIAVSDQEKTVPVPKGAFAVSVRLRLPRGRTKLQTWFTGGDAERGAYYVYARRLET